jgi:hypothetical protein
MSELMNPRVPGLGLAPAHAPRDIHPHRRDAHLYDALTHDAAATRPTVRAAALGTASALDRVSRRIRGAGIRRGAAEPTVQCRPSRPAARA